MFTGSPGTRGLSPASLAPSPAPLKLKGGLGGLSEAPSALEAVARAAERSLHCGGSGCWWVWVPACNRHSFRPLPLSGRRARGKMSHLEGHPPSSLSFCGPSSSRLSPRSCSHWLAQAAVSMSLTAFTAWDDLVKLSSLGGPGPGPHPSSRASRSARSSCAGQKPMKALQALAAPSWGDSSARGGAGAALKGRAPLPSPPAARAPTPVLHLQEADRVRLVDLTEVVPGLAEPAALFLLPPQVALGAAQHGGLALLDEAQHLGLEALQDGRRLCKQPGHPLPLRQGGALHRKAVGAGVRAETFPVWAPSFPLKGTEGPAGACAWSGKTPVLSGTGHCPAHRLPRSGPDGLPAAGAEG